ncbi:ABC transporter ATP-binding protein [Orbus mooreae]|uniref:ABC transporter ATP-binding protein n=1 Tax=Orbus mooreae TaxID=3074107 RepID=UPI00370D0A01
MIRLNNIRKSYHNKLVLNNINLNLNRGEIVCLLGRSGCGKSTLLRIIAGLILSDSGSINVQQKQCAMVFQEPRLLPWLSVAENLKLALPFWLSRQKKMDKIVQKLTEVQLPDCANLMPRELSGGMAQRVGIARALLKQPDILLLDEPFAALDALTRSDLQQALKHLIKQQNKTCLFVTHDIDEALLIGERIIVMQEGKLEVEHYTAQHSDLNNLKQQITQQLHYS